MRCGYHAAGACRSCTWLGRAYDDQLAAKQAAAAATLADVVPDEVWLPPVASAEEGFRNKAKMVVAGTVDAPTLGILDAEGRGTDLRGCGLHEQPVVEALPVLAELVVRARLTPYDVPARRGELKHVVVTAAPDGTLMVRWVQRSTEALPRLRKHLPWLRERLPGLRVASVNLQPEHKAVLEGEEELLLSGPEHGWGDESLAMDLGPRPDRSPRPVLHLRPRSFFQTSTPTARALYDEASSWVRDLPALGGARPASVLDLFCGVGGFALHLAGGPDDRDAPDVLGVEVSEEAVASARRSAAEAGLAARFEAGDAVALGAAALATAPPDLVVVNPPRRGIGDLAAELERSGVGTVLYSSCHPGSLARDLAAMPSLRPVRARLLDMFPQTAHAEVLVLLERG